MNDVGVVAATILIFGNLPKLQRKAKIKICVRISLRNAPLVSQFGRQRANMNAGGVLTTYRNDYDPRAQSKTKRLTGTTGATYQTRLGTRVQNLQPVRSKQQATRRPVVPQRNTIASNIFQLANALQAAKGTVGTPRREAKV